MAPGEIKLEQRRVSVYGCLRRDLRPENEIVSVAKTPSFALIRNPDIRLSPHQ